MKALPQMPMTKMSISLKISQLMDKINTGCKDPFKGRMYLETQKDRHFLNCTCRDNYLLCFTLQLIFLLSKSMRFIFPEILPQIDFVWYCWFYNLVISPSPGHQKWLKIVQIQISYLANMLYCLKFAIVICNLIYKWHQDSMLYYF